jgi:small conductance mechanosensitive channel
MSPNLLSLSDLYQNALDNLVWVFTWSGLAIVLIAVTWWWLPKVLRRALRWLDDLLPGDFAVLERPISRITVVLVSLAIIVLSATAMTSGLRGSVEETWQALATIALAVGAWLLAHGPRIILIVLAGLAVQRFASHAIPRVVERQVRARSEGRLEGEVQKNITTLSSVLAKASTFIVFAVALFMVMGQVGVNLAPLLVAAGVVGIAVGFGAQNLVRDVFAGVFIILENQYRVGDVVEIAGIGGLVEDINLRRTVLRDLDYRQHFIPNGEIKTATNFTKDKSRVNINVGVAYKEDLDRVISVLNQVGQEMAQDAAWGPLILDPIKVLRVDNLGESAVEVKVLGETVPIRQWDVSGEFRLRVKKAFDREGIEMPFPHRTLYWGAGEPNMMALRAVMEEAQRNGGGGRPQEGPRDDQDRSSHTDSR